jgi:hypothetical protein
MKARSLRQRVWYDDDQLSHGERASRDNREYGLKALQYCLGLSPANESESINERLTSVFTPFSKNYEDPVFISMDTEGSPVRQLGISILDTRQFKSLTPACDLASATSTFDYYTSENLREERYKTQKMQKYKLVSRNESKCAGSFGCSEKLSAPDLQILLAQSTVIPFSLAMPLVLIFKN